MAPKGAQPPPPQSALPDNPEAQREDAVIDAVETVCNRLNAYIEEAHLQSCVLDKAVDSCIDGALCVVSMAYVAREETPYQESGEFCGSWEPDVEPEPCSLDTWIRGAIPCETRKRSASQESTDYYRRGSRSGSPSRGSIFGGGSRLGSPSGNPGMSTDTGKSGKGEDGRPPKPPNPRFRNQKPLSPKSCELESQLREEIAVRKQQAQVAERTRRQDEDAKSNLQTLQKELRGKEYTYDHKGQVVVMNKVNPAKLPSATTRPDVNLVDPRDVEELEEGDRRSSKKSSSKSKEGVKRLTATKKAISGRKTAPDFVEKPSEAQPSAMETMRMARGVTLKQGGSSKAGPPRVSLPGQMTKVEYSRYIEQRRAQLARENGAAAGSAGGSRKTTPTDRARDSQSKQQSNPKSDAQQGTDSAAPLAEKIRATGEPPSWIKDGRPKVETETVVKQESLNVDLYLTNQPGWGTSGGSRVDPSRQGTVPFARPSQDDIVRTVGRTQRLPRTRAGQATAVPPVKPPPSVPKPVR